MRTARLLTVSQHALRRRGAFARWVWQTPPPRPVNRMTGQVLKHYLAATSLRAVKIPDYFVGGASTKMMKQVIGGSRGGRARRAPPHLPGILVFDDILGHIV